MNSIAFGVKPLPKREISQFVYAWLFEIILFFFRAPWEFLILSFIVNNAYLRNSLCVCVCVHRIINIIFIGEGLIGDWRKEREQTLPIEISLKASCCCGRGIFLPEITENVRLKGSSHRDANEWAGELSFRKSQSYERRAVYNVVRGHRASRCHTHVFFVWSNLWASHCCSNNWYLSRLR